MVREARQGREEAHRIRSEAFLIKKCAGTCLKVPKREIFDGSDFPDFYTIKFSWVGDLLVKILTYYFNF